MRAALGKSLKMPLRARINPRLLPNYSTSSAPSSAPDSDEVLFTSNGAVRTATLNRPAKLNAINKNMCELMIPRLLEYGKSDLVGSIVVKGAGHKAFSAGGDVTLLAVRSREKGLENAGEENADYFRVEFGLNHLIATYNKPYVSLWDGYVMGGGVGMSAHGSFRIATEKTGFAMPETKIGYFPDVGGLFYLSRLNGQFGVFAGLTSHIVRGYDAYRLGLASHYVNSELIPQVEARLSELEVGAVELEEYYRLVDETISEYASEPPASYKSEFTSTDLLLIDECFSKNTVEEIVDSLRANHDKSPKFVQNTLKALEERSPLSLKVTLEALRRVKKLDIKAALEQDMVLCHHFNFNPNFAEGVTALLIEKRSPKWTPATLAEVTPEMVEDFFRAPSNMRPVKFENDRTFKEYPHQFGLPNEQAVMDFVTGETSEQETKATRQDVLEHFKHKYVNGYKQGLEEYLNEILDRRTTPDREDNSLLDWNY